MKSIYSLWLKHSLFKERMMRLMAIAFIFLSILAIFKSIFISFDIDEGYAIAQSYRLLKGDHLFEQMWEPHQLSAFFSAIFMLPFLAVTGGSTTGIIIYLRVIGTLIHLLLALWLYCVSRRQFSFMVSLMITLLHINFLPKWVSTPEFELMHYWAVCILFLGLHCWNRERTKTRYLILASVALWVAIMSYPTMLILYPAYAAAILYLAKDEPRTKWTALLWFTLPLLLLGLLFIGYVLSYMSFTELLENVSFILMDESHSNSLVYRSLQYLKELESFLQQLLIYLAVAFPFALFTKKLIIKEKGCPKLSRQLLPILLLFTITFMSLNHLISSLLGDTNQFYLYLRYLIIVILGVFCMSADPKTENREYFLFGIIPGLLSVLASAAITNMTLEIALARVYIAVIATCFIVGNKLKNPKHTDTLFSSLAYISAIFFLSSLFMCKLLLVRVTGCIPISVKMHMNLVTDGPAAGLLLKEELAQCYNENTAFIKANLSEEDRLLYFGCENIYYLISDAQLATPSTQGTAVFNEMYLTYYEQYPEKLPNVVIIDKSFETNPNYNYSWKNQVVLDWIMEEFADAVRVETDYVILLRKII